FPAGVLPSGDGATVKPMGKTFLPSMTSTPSALTEAVFARVWFKSAQVNSAMNNVRTVLHGVDFILPENGWPLTNCNSVVDARNRVARNGRLEFVLWNLQPLAAFQRGLMGDDARRREV